MDKQQILEKLKSCELFNKIEEKFIETIISTGIIIKYEKDKVIFNYEDNSEAMYIVLDGVVKVYGELEDKTVEFAKFNPSDHFGEISMLMHSPRSAATSALTDCKLFVITHETFELLEKNNPQVAIRIYKSMLRVTFKRLSTMDKRLVLRNYFKKPGAR